MKAHQALALFYPKPDTPTAVANRKSFAEQWVLLLPDKTAKERATKAMLLLLGIDDHDAVYQILKLTLSKAFKT